MTGRYFRPLRLEAGSLMRCSPWYVPDDIGCRSFSAASPQKNVTTLFAIWGWWQMFSVGAEPVIATKDKGSSPRLWPLLPGREFDESHGGHGRAVKEQKAARGPKGLCSMPLRSGRYGQAPRAVYGRRAAVVAHVVKAREW